MPAHFTSQRGQRIRQAALEHLGLSADQVTVLTITLEGSMPGDLAARADYTGTVHLDAAELEQILFTADTDDQPDPGEYRTLDGKVHRYGQPVEVSRCRLHHAGPDCGDPHPIDPWALPNLDRLGRRVSVTSSGPASFPVSIAVSRDPAAVPDDVLDLDPDAARTLARTLLDAADAASDEPPF